MTSYDKVRKALQDLCNEAPSPGQILFNVRFTAKTVAERAGCSVSTARKYLDGLSMCRGYSRHRFPGGTYGYRYDKEYA
jgi:response regulator of citrate/malate metabolism